MTPHVEGVVAPGFGSVRDAFVAAFTGKPRMGAALAIRRGGDMVVDLWGGTADDRNAHRGSAIPPA